MPQQPVSRRDLARHLAAGAAVALTGPGQVVADDDPVNPPREAEAAASLSPVEAHMTWLLQRYPSDHLSQEQREGVRRVVERRLAQSEHLRQYPLEPADAPALVFAAYRGEDREGGGARGE